MRVIIVWRNDSIETPQVPLSLYIRKLDSVGNTIGYLANALTDGPHTGKAAVHPRPASAVRTIISSSRAIYITMFEQISVDKCFFIFYFRAKELLASGPLMSSLCTVHD